MMRKYFPLEASERLFVAVEEDDVVDAQVSLPPTIALSCTTEIIHDNYAGNDSNLLIVFYVQIMPDDFVMQLHR
ncbi:hypothetical protein RNN08_09395, partial [Escherichia coli]|nr:hypothetical protein [Escherichia coli]MDT1401046.1 hypothetical protein [Escherichia coli]